MAQPTHLAFWIEGESQPEDVTALEAAIAGLGGRTWTLEAPSLVDHRDAGVRSVGCALPIHDARTQPPVPTVDRLEYENSTAVAGAICELSGQRDLPFVVELDGEEIGSIDRGEQSRSLSEGFFVAWSKHLDDSSA